MDENEPRRIRNLWAMAPNQHANYWTIGYRLERDNSTEFGYHRPDILIEVYYGKIKPEIVADPEWLPKFAVEFKNKYYDQFNKMKDAQAKV